MAAPANISSSPGAFARFASAPRRKYVPPYVLSPIHSPAAGLYGRLVASFLVFRNLPGVTRDQYTAAQRAAADACRRMTAAGREVRYHGGFFLPGAGRAICVLTQTRPLM